MPGTVRVLLENLKREQEAEKKRLAERVVAKQLKAEQRTLNHHWYTKVLMALGL